MIRHIVMFKIKDEYKDEIPQLVRNFYGMKGKIEGMVSLEAGADFLVIILMYLSPNPLPNTSFTFIVLHVPVGPVVITCLLLKDNLVIT